MFVLQLIIWQTYIRLWWEVQRNIHDIVWQSFIITQTIYFMKIDQQSKC